MFDTRVPPPTWVDSEHEARKWIMRLLETHKDNGGLGLDSETTGLDINKALPIIWSLSNGQDRLCLDASLIPLFKEPILENPEIAFDFTNAKFDAHMFANVGVDLTKAGEWRDTVVMSWLRDENRQGRHGLKECVYDFLGRTAPTFEEVFGRIPNRKKGGERKTPGELIRAALADPERHAQAVDYASVDAYNTTDLRHFFDQDLEKVEMAPGMTLRRYYYEIEVPFTKVLWKMERRGVTVDLGYLSSLRVPLQGEKESIEREFAHEVGKLINLSSSASDLRWFFFDHLKKPVLAWTDGGAKGDRKPAIDNDVLETWAGEGDPWARRILRFRDVDKTLSHYVKGLSKWVDPTYRIHTSLKQTGTTTGRLSSVDPNLQNVKRSGDDEWKIRDAFIAGKNKRLFVGDLEQAEMRLLAHISGDQKMIDAINKGIDLHCLTAAEMSDGTITYEEVVAAKKAEKLSKAGQLGRDLTAREHELLLLRSQRKTTGFSIVYGIGGPSLAAELTKESGVFVHPHDGTSSIRGWLNTWPGVNAHIERRKRQAREIGHVQTLTGRFRRFGNLAAMSGGDRARAERQAVNAEVQGGIADIVKYTMLQCDSDPVLQEYGVVMLLQVHDELMFEGPDDPELAPVIKDRLKYLMETPFSEPLSVPIPADIGHGYTWASAK